MEATNSEISNGNEYTVGQISPYSEDDMLGIEPLELHFPFELNKEMSCSLELTNETDSDIAFEIQKMSPLPYCIEPHKGIVPPRSKCGVDITLQPQDKTSQRANEFIVRSTRVHYGFTIEHITTAMFNKSTGNDVDEVNLDVVFDPEVIPGSSMILDVHPLELCFLFEPNKLIACSLDLTNNTDEKLAFELLKKSDEGTCFLSRLPMFGVVDPRTTYTLVLIMNKQENLPRKRNVDLILQTSAYCKSIISGKKETFIQHFQNAEQLGITVHQVTLKCVCALQGETIFESIPPSIKIISMEDNHAEECYCTNSVDANQTEPLIITGFYSGHVHIWNCDTQKYMDSCKIRERCEVWSVKFIERKGWFLVGSDDGFIRVYDYKNKMQKTTSFKADGEVRSLAIHPTESYVLSASTTGIKLWDWDQGWKCMQTFKEHSDFIRAVAFNPEDHNGFASASDDGTIKVWSLDSPKSKYTLSGHSHWLSSLDFFTRDGQQYLISGSWDKTAKIWDMKKKECVHTLPHQSYVLSVLPHPKLPLLVTGIEYGTVYLWSSTDFRLNRILNMGGLSQTARLSCLIESGRVVVARGKGLSVIEINDEEEQGGSSSSNENSISAAD